MWVSFRWRCIGGCSAWIGHHPYESPSGASPGPWVSLHVRTRSCRWPLSHHFVPYFWASSSSFFLEAVNNLSHSSLLGAQHFHFPSFLHCVCVCGRYLDMLPTRFGNPLWFSDDDFLELKGTNLYDATLLQVNPLSCLSCDFFSLHLIIIIILKMNSFSCLFQKKKLLSLYHDKVEPLLNKLLLLDGVSERSTGFNIFKLLCSSSWPPNHFSFFFFFGLFLQQCFLWPFPLVCSLVISFFFFL